MLRGSHEPPLAADVEGLRRRAGSAQYSGGVRVECVCVDAVRSVSQWRRGGILRGDSFCTCAAHTELQVTPVRSCVFPFAPCGLVGFVMFLVFLSPGRGRVCRRAGSVTSRWQRRGRALLTNIDSFRRRHWGLERLVVGVRNAHRVCVNVFVGGVNSAILAVWCRCSAL